MSEYYVCTKNRDEHSGYMDGCILWWKPEGKGYTYDLNYAGIFTDENIRRKNPDPRHCHYIPKEIVDANTYSPRLAWWSCPRSESQAIFTALKNAKVSHV